MTVDNNKAMRMWNAGLTVEEILAKYGIDVSVQFAEFESKIGCRSFTVDELHSGIIGHKYPNRDEEPEWYRAWKGEIGPGKQLREIIKNS